MGMKRKSRMGALAILALAGLGLVAAGCSVRPKADHLDSDGLARDVTMQGIHAYLADGFAGLKIYNVGNGYSVSWRSQLSLAGFVDRVEVEGDWAVLNNTQANCAYVVSVADKSAPVLAWTIPTQSRVVKIAVSGNALFLAERGAGSFTGVEVFSLGQDKPFLKQAIEVEDLVDISLGATVLYTIDSHSLAIRARAGGTIGLLLGQLGIPAGDTLQSLDGNLAGHPLLLGQSLYLVNALNPAQPVLADQRPLPGCAAPRQVRVSEPIVLCFKGFAGAPFFTPIILQGGYLVYTTRDEVGQGIVELSSKKILFLLPSHDIKTESKGYAKLYRIALARPLAPALSPGRVTAVGALDNYGLAYTWME